VDQRTTRQTAPAIELIEAFHPVNDDLAEKSRALTLGLLRHTPDPFSRNQFTPGHITCTALVLHSEKPLVLFMHHHRLHRWLLPGGHVEPEDESLAAAAAREAREETAILLDPAVPPRLAGIDVHGIPPKKSEPYHLHHDLIWCFRAQNEAIEVTPEAPEVAWAGEQDWDKLAIAESIRRAINYCGGRFRMPGKVFSSRL
jgi:8-oxo-dGTP pyrophosphatase MutT (NUDIX family)